MSSGPTANVVAEEHLIACCNFTCEIFRDGSWKHLQDTLQQRQGGSSAVSGDAVLLIGGQGGEYSSEWIPVESTVWMAPLPIQGQSWSGTGLVIVQYNYPAMS